MHIPAPTSYNGNYTRFSFLHTIYTKVSISPYTPRAIDQQPKKMPIQSVTPWRGTTVSPSNSFAHMPILIFSAYWNLWRLEGLLSNLILFLSYQMDQITQPNTRPHNLFLSFALYETQPLNTKVCASIVEDHRDTPTFQYFHPGPQREAACKKNMRVRFRIYVAEGAGCSMRLNNAILKEKVTSF